MQTVTTTAALADRVDRLRACGERVALVPTMGALHEGHLALVEHAGEIADRVVVSIFVNPRQFDDPVDLAAYPKTVAADSELLTLHGCDILFLPERGEMYPPGYSTTIQVGGPALGLEGERRAGHFEGVATVVAKLLLLVRPDCAVFGEKDAQQLAVVRRLVEDLHLAVDIVGLPTVRAADGLALSSRNARLSDDERRAATVLYRALELAARRVQEGERSAETIRALLRETIESEPRARLEYAEVVEARTFQPTDTITGTVVLPVAAFVGSTRLIDNVTVYTRRSDTIPVAEPVLGAESADSYVSEN